MGLATGGTVGVKRLVGHCVHALVLWGVAITKGGPSALSLSLVVLLTSSSN